MPVTRFVILHHRERSGEHWDLMIEQAEALATWRLARMPDPDDPQPIPAERIADHRKAYLTYEGPLTRDRGAVTRVDEGACDILEQTDDCWRVVLEGQRLAGTYLLQRCISDYSDEGSAVSVGAHTVAAGNAWLLEPE